MPSGDFDINIILRDYFGSEVKKSFKVTVICLSFLDGAKAQAAAAEKYRWRPPVGLVQKNPPKPFIQYINNVGIVRVGFTEKL